MLLDSSVGTNGTLPIKKGKFINLFTSSDIPVWTKQAIISVIITVFRLFLRLYAIDGISTNAVVIIMLASSPTPPVVPTAIWISSFTSVIIIAGIGPYIKPASITNTLEKSSSKKLAGVLAKMGISKRYTTKDRAEKTAIPAIFLVVKVLVIKNAPFNSKGRKKTKVRNL